MPAAPRKSKTDVANTCVEAASAISSAAIQARVDAVDWAKVHADLDTQGWAIVPKLLTHAEADSIAGLYHRFVRRICGRCQAPAVCQVHGTARFP
jgi:hypothetical protein